MSVQDIRRAALSPGVERNRLFTEHPFVQEQLLIATAAANEFINEVRAAVADNVPGSSFIADYRFGKTTAIQLAVRALPGLFGGKLAVGWTVAIGRDSVTDRGFYGDLYEDLSGRAQRGTAEDRRQLVWRWIVTRCEAAESNKFLLFIDETQTWGRAELTRLRDTRNKLQKIYKISLIVVAVADPSFKKLADELKVDRRDVWSRFMRDPKQLRGIDSIIEFREFLTAHDCAALHEFPADSGISFSEFYCPRAFSAGWRFEKEADAAWAAFTKVAKHHGRPTANLGMETIRQAVQQFLYVASKLDVDGLRPDAKAWATAVASANYEATLP